MIHACCPGCRLRFTPEAAAYVDVCPECREPPQWETSPQRLLGFRLVGPQDLPVSLPEAMAVSLPPPELDGNLQT